MSRILILSVSLSLGLINIASGQSSEATTRTLLNFGLIGLWAAQCDHPASPVNNYLSYEPNSSGKSILTYDPGPENASMRYEIVRAERLAEDKIALQEIFLNNKKQTLAIVLIKANKKIRVWSSESIDGLVAVKDGVIKNGPETRWLERCR